MPSNSHRRSASHEDWRQYRSVWLVYIGLFLEYVGTRPRCPDPSTGRIHSINNHGTVAYLNHSENLWLYALSGGAVTMFGVAFALDRWKR